MGNYDRSCSFVNRYRDKRVPHTHLKLFMFLFWYDSVFNVP